MSDESREQEGNQAKEATRRGPARIGPESLPDPDVVLLFHGFSAFWRDHQDCVVGFYNGDGKHPLRINFYEDSCTKQTPFPMSIGNNLELTISNPDLSIVSRALFYQPDGRRRRRDAIDDPHDFNWIVDFESSDCYGNHLVANMNIYRPQMKVNPAIFYCLKKTRAEFEIRPTTPTRLPGNGNIFSDMRFVAEVIAANIYLTPGSGSVILKSGSEQKEISKGEIHFISECEDENQADHDCYDYSHEDRKRRNDFYLHDAAIQSPPQLNLKCVKPVSDPRDKGALEGVCNRASILTNDNAPCAGSGYGGSGGFPPYPPE